MEISFVVAAADNEVIGKPGGGLPWQQKADMRHFRELTFGHPIIMGRKTKQEFEKPLPDRVNIVISRQAGYRAPGWTVVSSIEEALRAAKAVGTGKAIIIGGGQIFEAAMPIADKIYLTEIHAQPEGAAYFNYDKQAWKEISREDHPADSDNQYPYSFVTLIRAV